MRQRSSSAPGRCRSRCSTKGAHIEYLPALALTHRHALAPTRGKQSGRALRPRDGIPQRDPEPVSVHLLRNPAPDLLRRHSAPHVLPRQERFDCVVASETEMPHQSGPLQTPFELKLVADEGFARLYRGDGATRAAPENSTAPIRLCAPTETGGSAGRGEMYTLPYGTDGGTPGSVQAAERCTCP